MAITPLVSSVLGLETSNFTSSRLPPEVWAWIFELALGREAIVDTTSSTPIQLAAVCQAWRRILLSNALLWTSVRIKFSMDKLDRQVDLLKLWLERTSGVPLSIFFTFKPSSGSLDLDFSSKPSLRIARIVANHADQIQSLDSIFSIYWQSLIEDTDFPILSKWTIRRYPESEVEVIRNHPDYSRMAVASARFPSLSEVTAENPFEEFGVILPWQHITRLDTRLLSVADNLHFLASSAIQVQRACFSWVWSSSEHGQFAYDRVSHDALIPWSPRPLPHLHHLSISASYAIPFAASQLLAAIYKRAPLQSLLLEGFRVEDTEMLDLTESYIPHYESFLLRVLPSFSSTLQKLELVDSVYEEQTLLDILVKLPGLTMLRVDSTLPPIVLTNHFLLRVGSGALLPKLNALDVAGRLDFTDEELIQFLRGRCLEQTVRLGEADGQGTEKESRGRASTALKEVAIQFRNARDLTEELRTGLESLVRLGIRLSVNTGLVKNSVRRMVKQELLDSTRA